MIGNVFEDFQSGDGREGIGKNFGGNGRGTILGRGTVLSRGVMLGRNAVLGSEGAQLSEGRVKLHNYPL